MTGSAARKRPSVNEVFGDSLPETTKDERDEHPSDADVDRDVWLQSNVPPHHG